MNRFLRVNDIELVSVDKIEAIEEALVKAATPTKAARHE